MIIIEHDLVTQLKSKLYLHANLWNQLGYELNVQLWWMISGPVDRQLIIQLDALLKNLLIQTK